MSLFFIALRRSSLIVLSLLLLSVEALAAPAKDSWIKVATYRDRADQDESAFYVQSGSIQDKGGYRYFTVYEGMADGRPLAKMGNQTYQGIVFCMSTECRKRTVQFYRVDSVNPQGEVIKGEVNLFPRSDRSTPITSVPASGWPLTVVKYVCSRR